MTPTLTYDRLVTQEARFFEISLTLQNAANDPQQFAHRYWRRLIEGWTVGDVLADTMRASIPVIAGPGAEGYTAPPPALLTEPDLALTYDEFLEEQSELAGVLTDQRGDWSPGDLAHNAWRRLVEQGNWTQANLIHDIKGEPLEPPPDPPKPPDQPDGWWPPPPGPCAFSGRQFCTVHGQPYLSHATHFMEAFSLWCRDEATARRQIAVIAEASHQAGVVPVFRFLDTLGFYDYWRGREVAPIAFTANGGYHVAATPNYYDRLADFLRYVRSYGAMVRWSRGDLQMFGGSAGIDAHIHRLTDVALSVGTDVCEVWEVCNEATLNGVPTPDDAKRYLDIWRSRVPDVKGAYGAPYGTEEPEELQAWLGSGDYSAVHGYRPGAETEEEFTKTLRHIFSTRREGYGEQSDRVRIVQGEPFGTGDDVSGGRTDNVEMLTLAACMSQMTGQAWTYMSGQGVRWNSPIEQQPGFYEVLRATAQIPADIYGWSVTRGGLNDNSFDSPTGYYGDAGVSEGPARIDTANGGGEFFTIVYGGAGRKRLRALHNVDGDIWNPASDDISLFTLQAGEEIEISYDVGRVLRGRYT